MARTKSKAPAPVPFESTRTGNRWYLRPGTAAHRIATRRDTDLEPVNAAAKKSAGDNAEQVGTITREDVVASLHGSNVPQLEDMARERGLETKGNKDALVECLADKVLEELLEEGRTTGEPADGEGS